MSFRKNHQPTVSRRINHSWFFLTIAQNPGKTPKIRGFRPLKPAFYRRYPLFTCHRSHTRPRTKSKHSADPLAPGSPLHPNIPSVEGQSRTPTVENGTMKPGAEPSRGRRKGHSARMIGCRSGQDRFVAKNARNNAPASASLTPPTTSGR